MRLLMTAGALLFAAALVIACGGDQKKEFGGDLESMEPAVAQNETPSGTEMASTIDPLAEPAYDNSADEAVAAGMPAVLAKSGDTMYVGGESGLMAVVGEDVTPVISGEIVSMLATNDAVWAAGSAQVRTLDGSTEVVPEFAAEITDLAADGGSLYVGTAGEGVWRLGVGQFESVSPEWEVSDLVATDFGLFAATTEGLFSFDGERWHRRYLGDSSEALATPGVLYYRYPYLYVGDGTELLRYDGGAWDEFADIATDEITALGWHNARLYIGALDGTLRTLDGTVVENAASPGDAAILSILRYDGRLHVATADGVYRSRFGKFEKLDLEETTESEPETEPIASL